MTASEEAMENEQEKGHVLEEFKEIQEVKSLIGSLENSYNDQIARETSCERFTCMYLLMFADDSSCLMFVFIFSSGLFTTVLKKKKKNRSFNIYNVFENKNYFIYRERSYLN